MKTKLLTALILFITSSAWAQTPAKAPAPIPYGEPITLEVAKKMANAAELFATNNQWTIAVAIVDTGGNLVLFEKMENTQIGSIEVAIGKAKTANNFKRPTKAMEDAIANGGVGLRLLAVPGVFPIEGGEPIVV